MRFLVTGITGFAGPHLAKLLLREGHDVSGMVRSSNGRQLDLLDVIRSDELESIKWVYADLTDYCSVSNIIANNTFDGIFHLAAQSHPPTSFTEPVQTFSANVMGSMHLISAVQKYQPDCRFHFCSTSEVYGNICATYGPLDEDAPIQPINPYGTSKAAVDLHVQECVHNDRLNGYVTRAFSHTGPRRGRTFSIASDAYQIARMMVGLDENHTLLVGNLETQRVVMDVRDCVQAYYQLMMSDECGIFNVCGDELHEMQYFTDLMIDQSGIDDIKQEIHPPFYRPIDIAVQTSFTDKLHKAVGWTTTIPIETTIRDLLLYWKAKVR